MKTKLIWAAVVTSLAITLYIVASPNSSGPPEARAGSGEGSTPPAMESFSYELYAELLKKHVDDDGMVDYRGLKASREGLDAFNRSIGDLDRAGFDAWSDEKKIAFWINAYNSYTLESIIDNYPITVSIFNPKRLVYPENSIRQIGGVWDKVEHEVPGGRMTLDAIEHQVLRKKFDEPRIHMALVCAAMGCPVLRNEPYEGDRLDAQLDDQSRKFMAHPEKFRIDRDKGRVYSSSIFEWFGEDFVKNYGPDGGFTGHSESERAVLNFVSRHLTEKDALYLKEGDYEIEYLDYDWSLNEQS